MKFTYDRVAGQSAERLAALSDGLFGVAMTLLLLDVHLPEAREIKDEHQLITDLFALAPEVLIYLMSFLTLGIFWIGQQTQLNHLERSDRHLTWMHLGFLFAVTLLPLTTRLLVGFDIYPTAVIVYWLNIVLLGAILYASFGYATRTKLFTDDFTYDEQNAVCKRIIHGQSLYALGAMLCFFNTYFSIGFIVLVQLNYVFAPAEWRWIRRPGNVKE